MNYSYQIWPKKASSILKNIILLQYVTDLDFLRVHQAWRNKKYDHNNNLPDMWE